MSEKVLQELRQITLFRVLKDRDIAIQYEEEHVCLLSCDTYLEYISLKGCRNNG